MLTTTKDPPRSIPADAAVPPVAVPPGLSLLAAARALHAVFDAVDQTVECPPGQVAEAVREFARAGTRAEAMRLRLLAVADKAQVAGVNGEAGTGAWAARLTRADGAQSARDVGLALALDGGLDQTDRALAEGAVSKDHARVIADTMKQLPAALTEPERARIERSLVGQAKALDPAKLRRAARRAMVAAERSVEETDAHEDGLLRNEEARAQARCRLTLHDNGDGTTNGSFTVPTFAASILRKTLQQMCAPRREAGSGAGFAGGVGATAAGGVAKSRGVAAGGRGGASATGGGAGSRGVGGDIDWPRRYGLAFTEILEHLPTDRMTGKVAATVVVTMDLDRLRAAVGAGRADTGLDLSASEARRIACNAGIVPAVLGGASQVLDLGRSVRYFSESQRTALATKYDECAAEGCDRPFAWSELHHETPWSRGGRTDLRDAVPLCGYHHRRIHDPRYFARIESTNGKKAVKFTLRT